MRNLVLKIVQGSYPAIPARYSRGLRSLVDSCLRNSPRDRPSISGILRLPFVQQRIESFLSETVSNGGREGGREGEVCVFSCRSWQMSLVTPFSIATSWLVAGKGGGVVCHRQPNLAT